MKITIHQSIGAALFAVALLTPSLGVSQTERLEATTTTTTSEGTVSEFGPQSFIIKTESGTTPIRYISSETTNYVDVNGNPIDLATVKSGLPVTVYYTKVGDTLIATKVMVRNAAVTAPSVIETTQAATFSAGVVSEFGPERILIRNESSPTPLGYTYSKTTTYVDESGQPVPINTLRSGLPVTVYYTKVGDTLVASKVMVRKAVVAPSAVIEKKTTTTTIQTDK